MRELLDTIETPYIDASTLLFMLREYSNPRDCIARMVKKGLLIRLKNGFFLIASRSVRETKELPYEQVANLLYGPSYVSLEWALSHYGFIPERVMRITSVTVGSSKEFQTPIGTFSYKHISMTRFSIGTSQQRPAGPLSSFLIATKEKALADWVFTSTKNLNEDDLLEELVESKRIDIDKLKTLDRAHLLEIAKRYRAKSVSTLASLIGKL